MKKFILISFVTLMWLGCERENDRIPVTYLASNAYSETEITYRNGDGQLVTEWMPFESVEDRWAIDMDLKPGDIVYISARYQDSLSSVKLRILIDGKVYKEGSSINEPGKYLVVSGTVPLD